MAIEGYNLHAWYYELSHASFTEDIDFYKTKLDPPPQTILELGCGSGRVLLPLAEQGHACWGLDNAREMLDLARKKIERLTGNLQVTLIQGDMANFNLGRTFDTIIIPHNTFMHLNSVEWRPCLRAVRRHLAPTGRLLIDLINPYQLLALEDQPTPQIEATFIDPRDQQEVVQSASYSLHEEGMAFHLNWLFEKKGEKTAEISAIYTVRLPHQLQLGLKQTGFQLIKMGGNYDGDDFVEASERLILEATRSDR
ncbi:MAG: class I SAM-dependent methyltransferase [Ardenticatenaceae bacterium]|nr:class I SAM-dependent methyltransferase [Ardenticatenaceae bacterium]